VVRAEGGRGDGKGGSHDRDRFSGFSGKFCGKSATILNVAGPTWLTGTTLELLASADGRFGQQGHDRAGSWLPPRP
jgi:hypothetical protein